MVKIHLFFEDFPFLRRLATNHQQKIILVRQRRLIENNLLGNSTFYAHSSPTKEEIMGKVFMMALTDFSPASQVQGPYLQWGG